MEHALQRPPQEPGKWISAAFSVLMHLLLVVALVWGVQWQRRAPEPVSVELVRAAPAPQPEPMPEPVRIAPPPPPKPVEIKQPEPPPKPVAKPDIALKEPEKKKPEKKPEPPKPEPPKVEKKPEPKPQPEKKPEAPQKSLLDRELEKVQAARTQSQKVQDSDRLDKMLEADAATASLGRISADWSSRISQKVKSNFIRPPGLTGDPKLVFRIQLLPSGEIIGEPQLVSNSSGNTSLEAAVKRAILKSSPLPKPEKNEAFQREINFTFYPMQDR